MFLVYPQISIQEMLDDFNDILNERYSPGGHLKLIYFNSQFPAINKIKVETCTCEMGATVAPPTESGNNNKQNCSYPSGARIIFFNFSTPCI